jgi:Zn-dependent protease with chaperone function
VKIEPRIPDKTADTSSARGTAGREFWQLVLSAVVLIAVCYAVTGVVVDLIVARISFDTEARMFSGFRVEKESEPTPAQIKPLERAKEILDRLRRDPRVPPLPYRLIIIVDKRPNAFAIPGGGIGITTGLMATLPDDISVAFVIGHELGHFHNRDHLEGIGRAAGIAIVAGVLFDVGAGADALADIMQFVLQRNYSQDRERAADRYGIELVHSVYGRVNGTDHLFRMLKESESVPGWAYMFSTHPSPRERVRDLQDYAATVEDTSF